MTKRYEAKEFYSDEARRQIDTTNALVFQAELSCRREMKRHGVTYAEADRYLNSADPIADPHMRGCRTQFEALVHASGTSLGFLYMAERDRTEAGLPVPVNPNHGKETGPQGLFRIPAFYSPLARRQVETAEALLAQSGLAYRNAVERAGLTYANEYRNTGDEYLEGRRLQHEALIHATSVLLTNLLGAERTRVKRERTESKAGTA